MFLVAVAAVVGSTVWKLEIAGPVSGSGLVWR